MTTDQGAIFIQDFAGKCIREKVMLEIPIPPQTNNRDEYTRLYKEYTSLKYHYAKHVASRRTFPYDVKEGQDGKELREGVDFEIKTRSAKYKCPRCRHTFKDKQDHGCMDGYKLIYEIEWEDILPVAVPIEPELKLKSILPPDKPEVKVGVDYTFHNVEYSVNVRGKNVIDALIFFIKNHSFHSIIKYYQTNEP